MYALTKKDSENIIEIGTRTHICGIWGKLRYRNDIETDYEVKEIEIRTIKTLSRDEINAQIEDDYNRWCKEVEEDA